MQPFPRGAHHSFFTDAPMPPSYLRAYRTAFEQVTANVESLTLGLSDEQFNWAPAPEVWSVGQGLVHLNTASEALLPNVERALRHAQTYGPFGTGPFTYGPLSRLFIWSVRPSSPSLPAPAPYRPPTTSALQRDATLQAFRTLQDRWVAAVEEAAGLDLRKLKAASEAAPFVRLSVGTWFEATPLHQLRHVEQAQRVLMAQGYPVKQQ